MQIEYLAQCPAQNERSMLVLTMAVGIEGLYGCAMVNP